MEAIVAHTRDVLELSNGELCVLRWLRISDGHATLSAYAIAKNSLFIVPHRLLKAGYVTIWSDDVGDVHYVLTERGREALEMNESTTFFTDLAKRRRARERQPREPRRDGGADRRVDP
jgi:DNA-binding PadR family transcriptional regulator